MKKTLLLAIFGLTLNIFAQNKQQLSKLQQTISKTIKNTGIVLENRVLKSASIHPQTDFRQNANSKINNGSPLIAIFDSIYVWKWDPTIVGWKIDSKITDMQYDSNNNLKSEIKKNWNGIKWINSEQSIFNFDVNKNLISEIIKNWNGVNWVDSIKIENIFNSTNNLKDSTTQYQKWNSVSNAWDNYMEISVYYDSNNILNRRLTKMSNGTSLENLNQSFYYYNPSNNLEKERTQNWSNGQWVDLVQYIYTYDSHKNNTKLETQNWNDIVWENSQQEIKYFDLNNNLLTDSLKYWVDSVWVNLYITTYNYDVQNYLINELKTMSIGPVEMNISNISYAYNSSKKLTLELYQTWNGITWNNSSKKIQTYDADNFTKSFSYKLWNTAGISVLFGDSTFNYYHKESSSGLIDLKEGNVAVYPNPTTGKFKVFSSDIIEGIEISNLLGEMIFSNLKINNSSREIDLSDYAKGIYVVRIKTATETVIRKIIVR